MSTTAKSNLPERTPAQVTEIPAPRASAAESARRVRRQRARRLLLRLGVFVALPTAVAGLYFGAFASDQYESVSLFTIHSSEARAGISMESLIGLPGASPTMRDTLAVRDYILSRDMLARLDRETDFLSHYKASGADWLSRLDQDASFEDAFEYYQKKLRLHFDSNSGVLTLGVRAYSADQSQLFSRTILKYSEEMVNQLAERARQDQIRFAQGEVDKAEKRLTQARQKLVQLQQERGEFNPEQSAAAAFTIRTQLEAELAKARAELAALRSYMAPEAPQVIAAAERVRSLAGQATSESQRLVNPKGEKGLNASLAEFEAVAVEKEFATQAYQSTLASLELARSDASRQHRYLATIAAPSQADEAQFPRRWLGVLTAFLGSFLAFGIGSLIAASIKEHARL